MKDIWELIFSMSSYMVNRRPTCKLYYLCTGRWVEDQNLRAIIDSGIAEIESIGIFESVSIDPLGASEIQKLFHETKNKEESSFLQQSHFKIELRYLTLMEYQKPI